MYIPLGPSLAPHACICIYSRTHYDPLAVYVIIIIAAAAAVIPYTVAIIIGPSIAIIILYTYVNMAM